MGNLKQSLDSIPFPRIPSDSPDTLRKFVEDLKRYMMRYSEKFTSVVTEEELNK